MLVLEGRLPGVMMELDAVGRLDGHRRVALDASHEHIVVAASNVRHIHSRFHRREAEVPSKRGPPETSNRNVLLRSTVKVQQFDAGSAGLGHTVTISDRSRFLDAKKSWSPQQSLRGYEAEM